MAADIKWLCVQLSRERESLGYAGAMAQVNLHVKHHGQCADGNHKMELSESGTELWPRTSLDSANTTAASSGTNPPPPRIPQFLSKRMLWPHLGERRAFEAISSVSIP